MLNPMLLMAHTINIKFSDRTPNFKAISVLQQSNSDSLFSTVKDNLRRSFFMSRRVTWSDLCFGSIPQGKQYAEGAKM